MRALLIALVFVAAANSPALPQEGPKCLDVAPAALKDGEILFLYLSESQPDVLESLVIFDGTDFKPVHNRYFKRIEEAFRVDTGQTLSLAYDVYSNQAGSDKCYWSGKLAKAKRGQSELYSYPKIKFDKKIDESLREKFYTVNTLCIKQLDASGNPKSECTKPILKATSDLNNNGRVEFWYIEPRLRDNGFAVAEIDESGKALSLMAER
jgi:hypothetical protein